MKNKIKCERQTSCRLCLYIDDDDEDYGEWMEEKPGVSESIVGCRGELREIEKGHFHTIALRALNAISVFDSPSEWWKS